MLAAPLQWIVGGYAVSFAMGLILAARLGDVYGRRRMFIIGALGFVASSGLCAVALNPGMLIMARVLEGAAAAMLVPQTLGIVHSAFDPHERQNALALLPR
jgi:MFS family permease